eukprot:TRINITY_DN33578_c0_g1_i1.p1 TRINITY_DN33578_c0_g1~~TRINITY_DN33578_c0_g1_i1.p1  ORF type:complete len:573 (+),score=106.26 TRINITY_DN33578_c0_g1_i1:68-1786(+)
MQRQGSMDPSVLLALEQEAEKGDPGASLAAGKAHLARAYGKFEHLQRKLDKAKTRTFWDLVEACEQAASRANDLLDGQTSEDAQEAKAAASALLQNVSSFQTDKEENGGEKRESQVLLCSLANQPLDEPAEEDHESSSSSSDDEELPNMTKVSTEPRQAAKTLDQAVTRRAEGTYCVAGESETAVAVLDSAKDVGCARGQRRRSDTSTTSQKKDVQHQRVKAAVSSLAARAKQEAEANIRMGRDKVIDAFRRIDVNGDGTLSKQEIRFFLGIIGFSRADELFQSIDRNSDGAVDFEEFVYAVFKEPEDNVPWASGKLGVAGKTEAFLLLLQDSRINVQDPPLYNQLLDDAIKSIVPRDEARHPQRAEAGRQLLLHSQQWMDPDSKQSVMDEEIVRQLFFDSMPSAEITIESIDVVCKASMSEQFLKKVAEERSSVEVVFHGTRASNVPSIIDHGLDTSAERCSRGHHGVGSYVAVHAGFAHLYTSASCGGRRFMFCILCDPGRTAKGKPRARHNFTTVDDGWNPGQYCFVDANRLLVTHLITYVLNGPGVNLKTALDAAIERSGKRTQRSGR